MADIFDKKTRSYIMLRIRSKNTTPELILRQSLMGMRLRYQPKMLGSPDFASKKHKVAVFVDGDFWHGYNWKKLGKVPPNGFWQSKIERNIARDRKYSAYLRNEGWEVIRFWEHEVIPDPDRCVKKIKGKIYGKK